jgi:hypothetical protein
MHTRLTTEGRGAVKIMAKFIGITAAIAFGVNEIIVAGHSFAAWCNNCAAASPARVAAASPVYYAPRVQNPTPATVWFHPQPVSPVAPVAVQALEPVNKVDDFQADAPEPAGITWYVYGAPAVRPPAEYPRWFIYRYRPQPIFRPAYQQRYFTSMYGGGHQLASRRR